MLVFSRRSAILSFSILALVVSEPAFVFAADPDSRVELSEITYRVASDNTAEITYHQRTRALTSQGRSALSQIQIPYSSDFQDVEFKFLKTLKKDGTAVAGDMAGVFDTSPATDPRMRSFSDSKLKTVLAPNLETGDAIEYEAVVHVRKWPKEGDFWIQHDQGASDRILSESVVLDLPVGRETALYIGTTKPNTSVVVNGRQIYRWMISNSGPVATSHEIDEPLFAVSSIRSWTEFGSWISSLNRKAAEPDQEISALAAKLIQDKHTDDDRIAALYAYVATKVRYTGMEFGIWGFQPHTATQVLHNAYGDCKDQTALLSALLTASGFKAYPVLTTPGVGVLLPDVPTPEQFSHEFVAVETPAGLTYLDTSMGPAPPGILPPGVRGHNAFIVRGATSALIEIPAKSPVPQRMIHSLKGRVSRSGVFEGSMRLEVQGFLESFYRREFLDSTDAEKYQFLQRIAGPEFRNAIVRQVSTSEPSDLTRPFWVACQLSDKDFFPEPRKSMSVRPELPSQMAAISEFRQPNKPVPVDAFFLTRNIDLIVDPSLTIVNGMPAHLKKPFGSFDSESSYKDGHMELTWSFVVTGEPIGPTEWGSYADFIATAQSKTTQSFNLERSTYVAPPMSVKGSTDSMREGAAAMQQRDYEAAKRAYLNVTVLDPQSPTAWNNLGRAYASLHQYELAERAYKRQISINPNDKYAYNNLGLVYRALRRDEDAIVWFRKQLDINPRDLFAHDNLCLIFSSNNQWEKAREEATIAVEIAPEDAVKWTRLGKAQIKTGHTTEANRSFERALALVHDAMTENNVAYDMADAGINLDRSWQLASGALDSEARQTCKLETFSADDGCAVPLRRIATMLDTAGWVLFRQGKLTDAEPYLRSAYAIAPRAETELHLSLLFAKSQRLDEALKYFAIARSRAGFSKIDSSEAHSELATSLGGDVQLESQLKKIELPAEPTARVIALVDEHGKVLSVRTADPHPPAEVLQVAKSQSLTPISWANYSLRSVRTIELCQQGGQWSVVKSYLSSPSELSAIR